MVEKAPAFQFYVKDFLTDEAVRLMSLTEVGVYIKLMCHCWLEGSLPSDPALLGKLVAVPVKRFERLWAGPMSTKFHLGPDGRLHHKRLDEEREKQDAYRRRQSDNAAHGWQRRGNAVAMPPHSQSGSEVAEPPQCSPISDLQSPISNLRKGQPREGNRGPTLLAGTLPRDHRGHGWCGDFRKCVPAPLHSEFMGAIGGDPDTRLERLVAFYERVMAEIPVNEPIGDDPWKFWRAHFAAAFPSQAPAARPLAVSKRTQMAALAAAQFLGDQS